MINTKINGINVDIPVRQELEQYDFIRARWTADKLIANSPMRYSDSTPSFFVNLSEDSEYYGCWSDSGAVDSEWTSGGFVKLLAFLRQEDYESTCDYLLANYAAEWDGNPEKLQLDTTGFRIEQTRQLLNPEILANYRYRHPYLERRGISEKVQRMMNVGYCKRSRAVTIPWRSASGRLETIKFRSVNSKVFWYARGAPVRTLLYGIDVVYKYRKDYAVLCEGEVDVLSFMAAGIPAIGIGGSAFTDEKAELILKSPIERLLMCTDTDGVGRKIREDSIRKLSGRIELADVTLPAERYKDANDVLTSGENIEEGIEELHTYVEQARSIGIKFNLTT